MASARDNRGECVNLKAHRALDNLRVYVQKTEINSTQSHRVCSYSRIRFYIGFIYVLAYPHVKVVK